MSRIDSEGAGGFHPSGCVCRKEIEAQRFDPHMELLEVKCHGSAGVAACRPQFPGHQALRQQLLKVEADMDDVPVFDGILLAFQAQLAVLAALGVAAVVHEVVVVHDLGADEAALDVAVDLAGGLHGAGAAFDRGVRHTAESLCGCLPVAVLQRDRASERGQRP